VATGAVAQTEGFGDRHNFGQGADMRIRKYAVAISCVLATGFSSYAQAFSRRMLTCEVLFERCKGVPSYTEAQYQTLYNFALKENGTWGSPEARIASHTTHTIRPSRSCLP
jgi:hypothetical protein